MTGHIYFFSVVYSFGIGFGDISPATEMEYVLMIIVLLISSIMNALILAQFASPIIDEEIVNYDLYCRLRNEKLVRRVLVILLLSGPDTGWETWEFFPGPMGRVR